MLVKKPNYSNINGNALKSIYKPSIRDTVAINLPLEIDATEITLRQDNQSGNLEAITSVLYSWWYCS